MRKRRLAGTEFCAPSATAGALIDDEAGDRRDGEEQEESVECGKKQVPLSSRSSSGKRQWSAGLARPASSQGCEVSGTGFWVESAEHDRCRS